MATAQDLPGPRSQNAGSARQGVAITPNDGAEMAYITRGIYVGGAGDVTVVFADVAGSVTLKAVPGGTVLPISVRQVMATGTTASNLVALYG